jgi:uncharacterized protein YigE (DUF2233 family)
MTAAPAPPEVATTAPVQPADASAAPEINNATAPSADDTGWIFLAPGVERRRLEIARPDSVEGSTPVQIVRLDQAAVAFQVSYAPDAPRTSAEWCNAAGVLATINGGFFEEDYQTTALLVSDGMAYGTSYSGQGGMFAVDMWGNVSLRYLPDTPYDPAEPLKAAIQGWPMLIRPGGEVVYTAAGGQTARRSVIAMDRSGNVLLLAFPGSDLTLGELAAWLAASDLNIDSALNLDGGSSTAWCVRAGGSVERVDAFVRLPTMLRVYPRQEN